MPNLKCEGHEEAGTKMALFLCQLKEEKEVVIKCSDTDILVIVLANMEKLPASLKVWTLFGVGNNRRYINMNKVCDVLGSKKCSGLPAFHALTGCDFNPAFYRKGKRKPWELYSAKEDFQEAFIALQSPDSDNYESAFTTLEDFVCKMYATAENGLRKCSNVDEARLRIFTQTYTNKIEPTDEFKQKLMNFDACILPPCKRELQQQLLRAAYIGHMWKNSFSPVPNDSLNVEEFGWKLENKSYSFRWFEGDDIPPNV
ncbi:unnamed protein product [Parnassius apollo]|uniref:(apollo) hypothetical protein n=1 Tax=Parnassius apollo TaxID=110799 RepID=A0A8S3WMJ0_PARAO|nr:unnamed protein product [Parnassius apollo]